MNNTCVKTVLNSSSFNKIMFAIESINLAMDFTFKVFDTDSNSEGGNIAGCILQDKHVKKIPFFY